MKAGDDHREKPDQHLGARHQMLQCLGTARSHSEGRILDYLIMSSDSALLELSESKQDPSLERLPKPVSAITGNF